MAPQPPTGAEVVSDARRYLGIPYVFGGGPQNPRAGLDCSGLVERVAFDLGIMSCPRTSEEQYRWGKVERVAAAGLMVFFVGAPEESGTPGHVGIVISPGQFIDAPHTGTSVQINSYSENGTGESQFMGYRSMIGVVESTSANQNLVGNSSDPTTQAVSFAGAIGGIFAFVAMAAVFILVLGLLVFGAILLFRGGAA